MGLRSRLSNLPTVEINKDLSTLRVIQRNLVYIINLPEEIAKESTLVSYEYFGQYGTIQKCIISHSKNLQSRKPTCNAYITILFFPTCSCLRIPISSYTTAFVQWRWMRS